MSSQTSQAESAPQGNQQQNKQNPSGNIGEVAQKFGNNFIDVNKKVAILAASYTQQVFTKQVHDLLMRLIKPLSIWLKSFKRYGKPDANEMMKIIKEMADSIEDPGFQESYKKLLSLFGDKIVAPFALALSKIFSEQGSEMSDKIMTTFQKLAGAPMKAFMSAFAGAISAVPGAGAVTGVLKIITAAVTFIEALIYVLKMPLCMFINNVQLVGKLGGSFKPLFAPALKILAKSKDSIEAVTKKTAALGAAAAAATPVPPPQTGGGKHKKHKSPNKNNRDFTFYLFCKPDKKKRSRKRRIHQRKRKSRRRLK